ncbi:hypothetical protein QFC22_004848 [Naganishia vaughanmartiniae]|uniref:Uncharacterized protein n=1 Tax=Naganishia vaughanmartiniae TaxID=1424756 RepID=A0ACC2WYF6_9TREE|nr:hypothetical protein QFC22_004848 [Naganishia vaughanmartiniae]
MVGVGTAINDDPRLNVRLLSDSEHHKTPQPIILDPNLRLPTNARMLTILRDPAVKWKKAPWLVCRDADADDEFAERRDALVRAGARVIPVPMTGGASSFFSTSLDIAEPHFDTARPVGRIQLPALPALLKDLGIRSLMVEGGAEIIQQFLQAEKVVDIGSPSTGADSPLESGTGQSRRRRPLADLLVVTVAPVLVPGGYSVLPSSSETQSLPTTTQIVRFLPLRLTARLGPQGMC